MKVVKCSDETYSHICEVAAKERTYIADAVDYLIKLGKESYESKRAQSRAGGKSPGKPTKRVRKAKPEDKPTGKLVEGMEDLYED